MMEIAEGNPCVIQWLLPGPLLFVLPGKLVPVLAGTEAGVVIVTRELQPTCYLPCAFFCLLGPMRALRVRVRVHLEPCLAFGSRKKLEREVATIQM